MQRITGFFDRFLGSKPHGAVLVRKPGFASSANGRLGPRSGLTEGNAHCRNRLVPSAAIISLSFCYEITSSPEALGLQHVYLVNGRSTLTANRRYGASNCCVHSECDKTLSELAGSCSATR
jgi:hypothetical protein